MQKVSSEIVRPPQQQVLHTIYLSSSLLSFWLLFFRKEFARFGARTRTRRWRHALPPPGPLAVDMNNTGNISVDNGIFNFSRRLLSFSWRGRELYVQQHGFYCWLSIFVPFSHTNKHSYFLASRGSIVNELWEQKPFSSLLLLCPLFCLLPLPRLFLANQKLESDWLRVCSFFPRRISPPASCDSKVRCQYFWGATKVSLRLLLLLLAEVLATWTLLFSFPGVQTDRISKKRPHFEVWGSCTLLLQAYMDKVKKKKKKAPKEFGRYSGVAILSKALYLIFFLFSSFFYVLIFIKILPAWNPHAGRIFEVYFSVYSSLASVNSSVILYYSCYKKCVAV